MGWDILGDVNNGWFAQVAHFGERVFKPIFGRSVYNNMGTAADNQMAAVNQEIMNQALANGATQQQALQAGSAAMGRAANPQNLRHLAGLTLAGGSVATTAVGNSITNTPSENLGLLMPLLLGAGVLGGTYLLTEGMSGSKSSNKRSNRE